MLEFKIETLLEEKFKEEDFSDCYPVEITLHKQKKLLVFIDCDSGVTFAKCRKISRFLEEQIEAKGWLPENYTIEVSSPGIDRPLLNFRQYKKNMGRNLEIKLLDGQICTGKLTALSTEQVTLEEKTGKKGKEKIKEIIIPFSEIKQTKVKITF